MWSGLETAFCGQRCPSSFAVERADPIHIFDVRRKFIAQGDDLMFRKKGLKAMSERWTKVIVHQ